MADKFAAPGISSNYANYVNTEDWVVVEMSDDKLDSSRVSGKELDRIDELADKEQKKENVSDSDWLLDRMFAVAVRESDRSDSAESLRRAMGASQDGDDASAFKELEKKRLHACNAIHDLDAWTGMDLVAVEKAVEGDWAGYGFKDDERRTEHVRTSLHDAVKAQNDYASELETCADAVEVSNPDRATALRQLAERTRARAAAIEELPHRILQASESLKKAGGDGAYTEQGKVLLGRRGFADLVYSQEAKERSELKTKATAAPDEAPDENFYQAGGTDALFKAFSALRKDYGDAELKVDRKAVALAAAHNHLRGLKAPTALFEKLRDVEKAKGLKDFCKLSELPSDIRKTDFNALADKYAAVYKRFHAAMEEYAEACADPGHKDVQAARKALLESGTAIDDISRSIKRLSKGFSEYYDQVASNRAKYAGVTKMTLDFMAGHLADLNPPLYDGKAHAVELIRLLASANGADVLKLSRDDVSALMDGTRRLSSEVEARVWGADGQHDKELDGAELIEVKSLGEGTFNAVKKCKFVTRDGKTLVRVFRPDSGASASLWCGSINKLLSKSDDLSGFSHNRAVGAVASRLGFTDVFPATTFGTLDGQPGMFLEYAPGRDGAFFLNGNRRRSYDEEFPFYVKSIPEANDTAVAGDVAKKLNRLQWFDYLTGQIDRHLGNVMIGESKNGLASVKGIDNDECFPDQSIGNGLLVFDSPDEAMKALGKFGLPEKVKSGQLNSLRADGLSEELTEFLSGKLVIDINKLSLRNRLKIIGEHKNFGLPTLIDAELKEMLEGLGEEDIAGYQQDLRAAGLTEKQVFAATARLLYVRSKVADVPAYGEDDWNDRGKLGALVDEEPVPGFEDEVADYNDEMAQKYANDRKKFREMRISDDLKDSLVYVQRNYYARTGFHAYFFGE